MKIKYFFSLLIFAFTFVSGLTVYQLRNYRPNEITAKLPIIMFLKKDSDNRRIFVDSLKQHPSVTTPTEFVAVHKTYVENIENMKLAGLPENFQIAWLRYAKVRRDSYEFLYTLKGKTYPDSLELKGSELDEWKSLVADENSAWSNIVSTAEKYGVEFDGSQNLKTDR